MRQSTFGEAVQRYSKQSCQERFLQEMDRGVPWEALLAQIEPVHYPNCVVGTPGGGSGAHAADSLSAALVQPVGPWSGRGALYDSRAMRQFVGIDLGREPAPDETTICNFRHLLEADGLGEAFFRTVGEHLRSQGLKVSGRTIVDATIINAPSSTKNREKRRDPEMDQTRKGNQWYFGMKAHIGVDADTFSSSCESACLLASARLGRRIPPEDMT